MKVVSPRKSICLVRRKEWVPLSELEGPKVARTMNARSGQLIASEAKALSMIILITRVISSARVVNSSSEEL
jgi:hypothetical protein